MNKPMLPVFLLAAGVTVAPAWADKVCYNKKTGGLTVIFDRGGSLTGQIPDFELDRVDSADTKRGFFPSDKFIPVGVTLRDKKGTPFLTINTEETRRSTGENAANPPPGFECINVQAYVAPHSESEETPPPTSLSIGGESGIYLDPNELQLGPQN